jgi:hypothetical protein
MSQQVYVLDSEEQPLMPTTRYGAVRRWLRDGDAIVFNLCPFTIKLLFVTGNKVQDVIVGLDTGAVNVGCSAVSGKKVLYASETKLRTDISKKMQRRVMYRKSRRARNTRYREARFENRKSTRQLPPSLQSKLDSTVQIVRLLGKILPIKKVIIEIAKFDTQKLQNPEIEGVEYQKGVTEGYDNVRAYVFERDNYTCQICKKKEGILQTHHIKQRKDGGSDRPDNMVTVHLDCHFKFHSGEIQHTFKKPKEYKTETQVTILKDFIVRELKKDFVVDVTFGHITKQNRQRLNLPKSHCFDAVSICNPKKVEKITSMFKRVRIQRGRYQLTKGTRGEQKLPTGKVFGFNQWDKVKLGKQIGFIKGRRTSGYFDICDIDGDTISHSVKYSNLKRLTSNKTKEVNVLIHPNPKGLGILNTSI